jgi:hypothetical protein
MKTLANFLENLDSPDDVAEKEIVEGLLEVLVGLCNVRVLDGLWDMTTLNSSKDSQFYDSTNTSS